MQINKIRITFTTVRHSKIFADQILLSTFDPQQSTQIKSIAPMNNTEDTVIENIYVHQVGNKANEDLIVFSQHALRTSNNLEKILLSYFFTPFKSDEYYSLYHDSDVNLNEVYSYVSGIFDDPDTIHGQSMNLAKHLYESSTHPKIKGGEFYVAYFSGCIYKGETVDAVGLFKSEEKDTFLRVTPSDDGFGVESENGVNINKLDKGCLIFNTERENGYAVAVVDNTNKGAEARYWIDDFLHVRQLQDEYFNTQNTLTLCKNFVTKELPSHFDVSKADQAELLNKSVKFFKEKDNFDMGEFAAEVIEQPDVIDSFNRYKESYQQERDIEIADNFTISDTAVKKQSRALKSVIKLDRNFHIYVHGDNQYLTKGYDEATGMHYYQLFFKEEL